MTWVGITLHYRTDLHIFNGLLTGQVNRAAVLENHVSRFVKLIKTFRSFSKAIPFATVLGSVWVIHTNKMLMFFHPPPYPLSQTFHQ